MFSASLKLESQNLKKCSVWSGHCTLVQSTAVGGGGGREFENRMRIYFRVRIRGSYEVDSWKKTNWRKSRYTVTLKRNVTVCLFPLETGFFSALTFRFNYLIAPTILLKEPVKSPGCITGLGRNLASVNEFDISLYSIILSKAKTWIKQTVGTDRTETKNLVTQPF
jgi:hypothetical protein